MKKKLALALTMAVGVVFSHFDSAEAQWDDFDDDAVYTVVINHEEQYSIWWADRELPPGWESVGKQGSKQECLDYLEEVWTDMRPRSLRNAIEDYNKKLDPEKVEGSSTELIAQLISYLDWGVSVCETLVTVAVPAMRACLNNTILDVRNTMNGLDNKISKLSPADEAHTRLAAARGELEKILARANSSLKNVP